MVGAIVLKKKYFEKYWTLVRDYSARLLELSCTWCRLCSLFDYSCEIRNSSLWKNQLNDRDQSFGRFYQFKQFLNAASRLINSQPKPNPFIKINENH